MNDLNLVNYLQNEYSKEITDIVLDLASKTIDYHKLTLNLVGSNSITLELNKGREIKAGE